MRLLFPVLYLVTTLAYAQKTKDHTVVVAELAEQIQSATFPKVPVRLAVVTFVPVQGANAARNVYGDYLTESIIGKLSSHSDKLKLFERKRVDAILKENEFMLSGLMKPSEALRIGELLPIDALFSGTYTKLKSYIDVTGRLIDVTSGEILTSYTGRIRLTKNIKTLFPEDEPSSNSTTTGVLVVTNRKHESPSPETAKRDREEYCKLQTTRFQEKLHDLSTSGKIDALVQEAIQTPFENMCGKLHYHMIDALSRYNIYPPAYQKFLLSTLDTISFPSGDDRAYSILSYVTKDGRVSQEEWQAGLSTVRKVGDYTLSAYLGFLFNKVEDPDSSSLQKRAGEYFDLLERAEVGLPRPIGYDKGFYELMEALSVNRSLRLFVYRKYGQKLMTEADNSVGLHLMFLRRMYNEETDATRKTMVIKWIAAYFKKHVNKKSSEQLYDLARDFVPYPNPEKSGFRLDKNQEAALAYPRHDLGVLVDLCREKFSEYAVATQYPSQKEDRVYFCLMNGIAIPGVIPTIPEARAVLQGNSIDDQHRIMKLLVPMGTHVAPLEKNFIAILARKSLDKKELLKEIQTMALEILGNLQTSDASAISHMVASLRNYDKASEASSDALISIGKPAVKPLVDQLNATTIHDGGLQYKIVVILGKIGKDARSATPTLQRLLGKTSNEDIRYAIEATLQAFQE